MKSTEFAVLAQDVYKHYRGGDRNAGLNGFSLCIRPGTVCALLGPNGAGKTTAVRIFSTLLSSDSGKAEVAGYDLKRNAREVRMSIGLIGQNAAVDEILGGRENLVMFARLYRLSSRQARKRADELLEQFGLTDLGNRPVSQYSGGLRRRLDLAASLIVAPKVLFLDEPTAGLDPRSRQEVWNSVRALVRDGTTVLLTTQYLEEADRTADWVSVLNEGRVIAEGTPQELKSRFGGGHLELVLQRESDLPAAASYLESLLSCGVETESETRTLRAHLRNRSGMLFRVSRALDERNLEVEDLVFRRPTLDEVFLHLTDGSFQADRVESDRKIKEERV